MKHEGWRGRLVIVGFGSIGRGVLPLILRHIDIDASRITIITADQAGGEIAAEYNVKFVVLPITPANYRSMLEPLLSAGDFLLNVSVNVSSVALIGLARERGALYLDTCIEPWPGGYDSPKLTAAARSNFALRESALALRRSGISDPTAVITHGANPGLVSHLLKQALLDVAQGVGKPATEPTDLAGWAALMEGVGIRVIHIAERDTQVGRDPKHAGEFVNTWSIDGFVGEGRQPSELGWGTHERHFPVDGRRQEQADACAIYLMRPGASVRVRSWTPREGAYHGFLITHGEAISIADHFTVLGPDGRARFRPTVHYAYHPCDDAVLSIHEFAGKNWEIQPSQRLMMEEIVGGVDELGVLLAGHARNAYWFGTVLSTEEARTLAPHNNATSLQVTISVLAGMIWALENPREGIVEPDEIDHRRILEICTPYLGHLTGAYTDWTPLEGRGVLFPEDIDTADPWQFKNIRVV